MSISLSLYIYIYMYIYIYVYIYIYIYIYVHMGATQGAAEPVGMLLGAARRRPQPTMCNTM